MSQNATYCFLINTASNAYQAEQLFKQKEDALKELFPRSEFTYIRSGDSIEDIARSKASNWSTVVACGGDGTINKVSTGLFNTKTTLGVIPLGSGNDFAKSIGLSGSFGQAIQVLKSGQVEHIDLISSDYGCFINTLGIGVDGAANYYASKSNFK